MPTESRENSLMKTGIFNAFFREKCLSKNIIIFIFKTASSIFRYILVHPVFQSLTSYSSTSSHAITPSAQPPTWHRSSSPRCNSAVRTLRIIRTLDSYRNLVTPVHTDMAIYNNSLRHKMLK